MGGTKSKQTQLDDLDDMQEGDNLVGFENKNNICYANSVIQALYYTKEFRQRVIDYKSSDSSENPISLFSQLFRTINQQSKRCQTISNKKLMNYVRKNNEVFQGDYHQDSHEFLFWVLDKVNDILIQENKAKRSITPNRTWLQEIFEECLTCRNVTVIDEPFMNLSLDLEENSSINYCLKRFEHVEILDGSDKFHCNKCQSKQVANKMTYLKQIPPTLIIHLKRFKYMERMHRMEKLHWKIAFPFELRAVIVHIGPGLAYGHYISIVRIGEKWFLFDDENIQRTDERGIYSIFGSQSNNSGSAYMLFYEEAHSTPQP